jgi:hypothetical protein
MAEHKFQAIETVASLSALSAYQISNSAVTTTQLTNESQLSDTGKTWGNFTNTAGIDTYSVYFFFSASSVVINTATTGPDATSGSKYTDPTYTGCSVYDHIYSVSGTGLYAIKLTFPERYESTAGYEDYTSTITIKTNEDAVSMTRQISIRHTYCQSAS